MSAPASRFRIDRRRLRAMMVKEFAQIMRDPSTFLIALAMPLLLLFLFGYAVSLDTAGTRVALVMEDSSAPALELAQSYRNSPYFDVEMSRNREAARRDNDRQPGTRDDRDPAGFRPHRQIRQNADDPDGDRRIAAQHRAVRGQLRPGRVPELGRERRPGWRPGRRTADRSQPPLLVQSGAQEPLFPRARLDRHRDDHDRHAADRAGGGARMGTRHDGSDHGDPGHHGRVHRQQDPALLPARARFDDPVHGDRGGGVRPAVSRIASWRSI